MKKLAVIALTLEASTVVLSGCGEKKIEPNNYYCTTSVVAGGFGREELETLAQKGRIDNAYEFIQQCKAKKLGRYSEEFKKLDENTYKCKMDFLDKKIGEEALKKCENAPQELFEKWKKEAEAEQYLICLAKRQGNFKRNLSYE